MLLWAQLSQRLSKKNLDEDTSPDQRIQRNMISYIHENYGEKLTLEDIAAAGGVSKSKCGQLFKRYAQETPIEFLNHYRLEMSRTLLRDTEQTATEIAYACGFVSASYFGKLFGELYHCTPLAFRREARGERRSPVGND